MTPFDAYELGVEEGKDRAKRPIGNYMDGGKKKRVVKEVEGGRIIAALKGKSFCFCSSTPV